MYKILRENKFKTPNHEIIDPQGLQNENKI